MKTLIIYDNTGKVWGATCNQEEVPKLYGMIADINDLSDIGRVDVDDPENPRLIPVKKGNSDALF